PLEHVARMHRADDSKASWSVPGGSGADPPAPSMRRARTRARRDRGPRALDVVVRPRAVGGSPSWRDAEVGANSAHAATSAEVRTPSRARRGARARRGL